MRLARRRLARYKRARKNTWQSRLRQKVYLITGQPKPRSRYKGYKRRRGSRSSKVLGLKSKTWWYLLGAGVLAYLFTPFKSTVNGLFSKKQNQA